MLQVQEISYKYKRGQQLFEGLSLNIRPGEVVGLYGKSGMGKTTMAKIIAGYLNPNSGKIIVDHKKHRKKYPNPVQLIWQHPEQAVNPRWKMKQVLTEAATIQEELIQQLNIKESWMHRYPGELSGGELQRFCLARALSPTTKYIIADEITTMLDAITQAQIWKVMLHLKTQQQLGILAISHDKTLLDRISDRILNFEELIKEAN